MNWLATAVVDGVVLWGRGDHPNEAMANCVYEVLGQVVGADDGVVVRLYYTKGHPNVFMTADGLFNDNTAQRICQIREVTITF